MLMLLFRPTSAARPPLVLSVAKVGRDGNSNDDDDNDECCDAMLVDEDDDIGDIDESDDRLIGGDGF